MRSGHFCVYLHHIIDPEVIELTFLDRGWDGRCRCRVSHYDWCFLRGRGFFHGKKVEEVAFLGAREIHTVCV